MNQNVKNLLSVFGKNNLFNWKINFNFHFGGYAKFNGELLTFCKEFNYRHKIEIEPIYTGKMFYGIFDLIRQDYFQHDTTIVAIHSGGLQGIEGLKQRGIL